MLTKEETQQRSPFMWWHWQNLNDGTQRKTGWLNGRCWWHFRNQKAVRFEWVIGKWSFSLGVDWNDDDVTLCIAPLFCAFYLSWSGLRYNGPSHEIGISMHDWTLRINPWSKRFEWHSKDPWWIKGLRFDLNIFRATHMRHEVRCFDSMRESPPYHYWVPFVGSWEEGPSRIVNDKGATMGGKKPDGREVMTYPYRYVLKNGTVQDRIATVHVERRAWRPKCLRWTSIFETRRESIDVAFSDEVGERTSSWKGGTIGCGYDLLPGETPEQSLRRMEATRKF